MKDRFKFRGKVLFGDYEGEWKTGFYTWCEDNSFINCHESILIEEETNFSENILIPYNCDPKTIGQCTGLKDKNGVLIFENDILTVQYVESIADLTNRECACYVKYISGCFVLINKDNQILLNLGDRPNSHEITGNIHE